MQQPPAVIASPPEAVASGGRLQEALDALPEGVSIWQAVLDEAGSVHTFVLRHINAMGRSAYRGDRAHLAGATLHELVPVAVPCGLFDSLVAAHVSGVANQIVTEVADDVWRGGVYDCAQVPMPGDLVLSVYRDISERARGERLLAAAYEETAAVRAALHTALDSLHEAFALFDISAREPGGPVEHVSVVHANSAAAAQIGAGPDDVVGVDLRDLMPYAQDSGLWEVVLRCLDDLAPRGHRCSVEDADLGLVQAWDVTIAPVGEEQLVLTWRDATAEEQVMRALASSRDQAMQAATHDALTGLPNAELARQRLAEALVDCLPGERVGIVFVDLNSFKQINDTFGHAAGDDVLKATARRLARTVRRAETASRLSGDEFLLILRGLPPTWDPTAFRTRVHEAISEPVWVEGAVVTPSASLGVVLAGPGHGAGDVDTFIRRSDAQMYEAKRAARRGGQIPAREASAAHDILATGTRGRIDALVRLLQRLCKADEVHLGLVDAGGAGEGEVRRLRGGFLSTGPASQLYQAVLTSPVGVVHVPDTAADPVYREDPLVSGPPPVRRFSGARLEDTAAGGACRGIVCMSWQHARPVTDFEHDALVGIAAELAAELGGSDPAVQVGRGR